MALMAPLGLRAGPMIGLWLADFKSGEDWVLTPMDIVEGCAVVVAVDADIGIVMEADVFMLMTSRLLTSSSWLGLISADPDGSDKVLLRLLGSPLILLRINWVAAEN
jgi:hypothetical protein